MTLTIQTKPVISANFLTNCISLFAFFAVIAFSIWQGSYSADPHHWGLMLGNVVDLSRGLSPYSEIFIQYGILTTLIQYLGYVFFGGNLISIITITAIFYAVGMLVIQRITEELTGSKKIGIYALITCILFHPLAIYPWSNYIAFPFLMGGVYFLIKSRRSYFQLLLAGLLLGCACLSREGLFYAVVIIALTSIVLNGIQFPGLASAFKFVACALGGLALPLAIFFFYLQVNDLFWPWYKIAVQAPKAYLVAWFPHMATPYFWLPLARAIVAGIGNHDVRWTFIALIILVNIYVVLEFFILQYVLRQKFKNSAQQALIAVACLVLLTSAMHIPEVFRLATGSIVGLVNLYAIAFRYKRNFGTIFFVLIALLLLIKINRPDSGNYFYPTAEKKALGLPVATPQAFRGQIWTPEVTGYYSNITQTIVSLQESGCVLRYQRNLTKDGFIPLVSPLKQFQLTPFAVPKEFDFLNSSFDLQKKIDGASDIVLLQSLSKQELSDFLPPDGFYVASRLPIPRLEFMPENQWLLIMAPKTCKKH